MNKNYVLSILIGCLCFVSGKLIGQVVVTPATGGSSICVGGNPVTLGAITLTETANGDMANGASSYTLNTPANFQFDNTATITFGGGTTAQLTGITSSFPTSTSLKVDFTVSSTGGQIDKLVINGIKVLAITSPAFGNIVSNTNTLGVSNTVNNGTLFSISTPSVSITNPDASVCTSPSANNTTFTAYGASTYQFYVDGVSVQGPSATATLNYHWNSTAGSPHAVHVVGTSNGCPATSSNISMAVNQTPTINWSPSDQSFALGDADNYLDFNGSFTQIPSGGTNSFSGNGVSFSSGNYLFSPSAAGNGTSTITLTYTRSGCTATTSQPFVVSTANSISGMNSSYCNYSTGNTLTISPPAGKTVSKFQYVDWTQYVSPTYTLVYVNIPSPEYTGGNFCTFSPVKFAGYTGGLYYGTYGYAYVRVLYTDGSVSPLTTTYVYDKPYVSVYSPITELCQNGSNVTLSIYPPDNGVAYTQATGTGVSETSPGSGVWQIDPSGALGPRTITYFYETTYSPQCQNSATVGVNVNPPPTANITTVFDPAGYCQNTSSYFALNGTPAGGNFSGPGTYANYFYPYYYTTIGPNVITYTYTDVNGCSATKNKTITIFTDPSVAIRTTTSDTSVCLPLSGPGTYTLEGKYQGAATGVTWEAYDGATYATTGNAGSFSFASPSSGFNTATSFTNSTYQSNQGYARMRAITTGQPASCPAAYDDANVFLIPKPNIIITNLATDKYCTSDPNISLSAVANYKYPYGLALLNGSDASNTNIILSSVPGGDPALVGKVFVPSSASTGNHQIRYSYTDLNGCSNFNDTILVINKNPTAVFIVDSGRCATKYTYFDAAPSFIPPSTTVTYTWDFGDGTSLADTSHIQKPKYIYPFPGGYPVSLTLLTNQGCSDTKALTGANLLTIQSIPVSNFDFKFQCLGDLTTFDTLSVIQAGAKKNRTWIFADNSGTPISTQTQTTSVATTYIFPKPANYLVTMIDSTTLGCTDRKTRPVYILPYISPTVTNPYAISFTDSSGNWGQDGANSTWVHEVPNPVSKSLMYYGGAGITDSVWVTSDPTPANLGNYKAGEKSSLNSPCINFSQLDKPMISIKLWTATQEQIAGAVLNTSIDNGLTWNTVGKLGDGIAWYNTIGIAGSPGNLSTNDGWSGLDTAWRQAKIGLPMYANFSSAQKVRFKITFGAPSDPAIARSEGIAIDSIWIGNKNKVVMMEHFTNNASDGSTTPAITNANNSMNTVRDTRKKDVAAVYYHTSFPAVDLFNSYFPAGPSSRVLYYGVTSSPRTVLDGTYYNGNIYSGSTPDARIDVNDVDARSLETAIFDLAMTTSFNPGIATVATKITYNGAAPFSNDLVLHTVITEDDSSGAVKYASVARQMLPDAAGSYISRTWNKNDNITMGQTWNHSLPAGSVLGAVTFIQNASTKEIYQAAYLRGPGSYGSPVATGVVDETEEFNVKMFPNPATDEVFFLYGKALRTASDWEVYDNIGRKVESGTCSVGREGFSINTSNYTGGIYYIKLKGENGAVDHKELVVIH
jgi:hypothetical protein